MITLLLLPFLLGLVAVGIPFIGVRLLAADAR